jgi:hypothetical protein
MAREEHDPSVQYLHGRTIVRIDGTATIATDKDGKRTATRASEVSIGVEADYDAERRTLTLSDEWWRDRKLSLSFAPDGRLAGATHESKGLGGQVIGAGLSILATLAKAAPILFAIAPGELTADAPVAEKLNEDDEQLAALRGRYARAIKDLQDRLADLAETAASDDPPSELHDQLETVQLALSAARAEAAVLEAMFDAWHAKKFPKWTQKLSYLFGTDQLVRRAHPTEVLELDENELVGDLERAALLLGIVVVRIGADPTQHTSPDDVSDTVAYRIPSRVDLAVYEAEDQDVEVPPGQAPQLPSRFLLQSVVPAWVIDADSEYGVIPLQSRFFHTDDATLEFGDTGTLSKFSNSASGTQLIDVFGGAGAKIVGGLDEGGKIAKAFPAPSDPSRKALEDEVTLKELQARLAKANRTIAGTDNDKKS